MSFNFNNLSALGCASADSTVATRKSIFENKSYAMAGSGSLIVGPCKRIIQTCVVARVSAPL